MLNVFYLNSKGKRIDFDNVQYILSSLKDLLSYAWTYSVNDYSHKIGGFQSGVTENEIRILARGTSQADLRFAIKKMEDVFADDLIEGKHGKLFVNEYYLTCYIVACSDVTYSKDKKLCKRNYKLVTDAKMWIKDVLYIKNIGYLFGEGLYKTYSIKKDISNVDDDVLVVENTTNREADLIIRARRDNSFGKFDTGPTYDLNIYRALYEDLPKDTSEYSTAYDYIIENYDNVIGLNSYSYRDSLENIEINTSEKTLTDILFSGERFNIFGERNIDYDYIFTKLPSGKYAFVANNTVKTIINKSHIEIVVREYYTQPELEE